MGWPAGRQADAKNSFGLRLQFRGGPRRRFLQADAADSSHFFGAVIRAPRWAARRREARAAPLLLQARQIVTNQPAAKTLAHGPAQLY